MKSIQPAVLTFLSILALAGVGTVHADNAPTISSDGFLELTLEEAPAKAVVKPATVAVKPAARQASKTKSAANLRAERKKRAARKLRAKRAEQKRLKRTKTYRVRRGDTLNKIARKTGVSVSRLTRLNRLHGARKNHIEVGQRLRIR